ncbi:MAG: alginate export family protein [Candidatus Obscuribacterales bacterium]|nr:alginate export family protein [Steroidobacteraceae bacterium]
MSMWNAKRSKKLLTACTLLLSAAQAMSANPIMGAVGEIKPLVDVRVRYENVEQVPLVEEADAGTIRARLGIETGKAWNTALLVEGEFVTPWLTDYRPDPSVPTMTAYPVVPDPEAYELNRLHLTNTSIANTTITLGRQRLNIDDQRFVGNVGWRQNEQTFDALRVVNKPGGGNFTFDATYSNRVNRIFGDDSPQGDYKGDLFFGNAAYQFKIGKLTAFGYFLDFDPILPPVVAAGLNPARVSTQTLGVRFAGERPLSKFKLGYAASYAMQDDHGANPLVTAASPDTLENDYYLAELTATYKQFSLLLGNEVLEGNGTVGFSAPLGTLHKFQGWVDKFLTTPAFGIDDKYATFTTLFKGVGPFDTVTAIAAYHTYDSELMSFDYGDEINFSLAAKWQRFTGMIKYGDYKIDTPILATPGNAGSLLNDTKKLWVQVDFVW